MMAFFLLLWLLNSVTQETLEGISNIFAPITTSKSATGSGDILAGKTIAQEGVAVDLPPPKAGTGGEAQDTPKDQQEAKKQEDQQFQEVEEKLRQAVEALPQLRQLKDSLLIDNTPEGLRIQLIDREGFPLFPSGSAEPHLHTKRLLEQVSKVIQTMPQQLSISGHTDAVKYVTERGYSNWELSADRANAARRSLVDFGTPGERVNQVVGKAETEPLVAENPKDARNRRLAIIMLRGTGTGAQGKQSGEGPRKLKETLPGLDRIREQQLKGETKSDAAPAATPPAAPARAPAPAAAPPAQRPRQ